MVGSQTFLSSKKEPIAIQILRSNQGIASLFTRTNDSAICLEPQVSFTKGFFEIYNSLNKNYIGLI